MHEGNEEWITQHVEAEARAISEVTQAIVDAANRVQLETVSRLLRIAQRAQRTHVEQKLGGIDSRIEQVYSSKLLYLCTNTEQYSNYLLYKFRGESKLVFVIANVLYWYLDSVARSFNFLAICAKST